MSTADSTRQLGLLWRLWWRHMRRRATRMGDAPKQSGLPGFLLINLLGTGYMVPLTWRNVVRSVEQDAALFTWHMLGVLCIGFATGLAKGVGTFQVRGTRNDAFLEALPLTLPARLGLSLADTLFILPLTLVVPLAAWSASGSLGAHVLPAALLGPLSFVVCFVLGQSVIAWTRALAAPSRVRLVSYVAVALNVGGFLLLFVPVARVFGHGGSVFAWVAAHWLATGAALLPTLVAALLLLVGSYHALAAAERRGFDRLGLQARAPKRHKGVRDRAALEWQMMLRQGGRALLILFGALLLVLGASLIGLPWRRFPPVSLLYVAGFVVYLAVLQVISQAGRAARNDVEARAFLAALPLLPHQVLEGKARALRKLLVPAFLLLATLAGTAAWLQEWSYVYRLVLTLLALYVVVAGAVSVAFLSSGIGVVAVVGAQPSSGFSTQLLMIPLFATVAASNDWSATTAFIAMCAVTWEAHRAAKRSVRWLDDSADDVERETTVWRALLAATAFFTVQALSVQLLGLFELSFGYRLAIAYASGSLLLGLLTWRNGSSLSRPAFFPKHVAAWPLAALAGAASGMLALWMVKIFPPPSAAELELSGVGESLAMLATMVVVAPLVEEYFFRGWLQRAIEHDLPDAHKRWAFVLGAVAFALVHIGSYGVPQLVLGLIAGALYAKGRGLLPGMLAHAIHNGVVVFVASS